MSLLGGLGYAAGGMADKYIEQEIDMQKQKAVSENALNNAKQLAGLNNQYDIDKENRAFQNEIDPVRQQRLLESKIRQETELNKLKIDQLKAQAGDPDALAAIAAIDRASNATTIDNQLINHNLAVQQFNASRTDSDRDYQLKKAASESKSLLGESGKYAKDQADGILKTVDDLNKLKIEERDPAKRAQYQQLIDQNMARVEALNSFGFASQSSNNFEMPTGGKKTSKDVIEKVNSYDPIIKDASIKFNVQPEIVKGIITIESRGDNSAQSPTGVNGLMQITGDTGRSLGIKDPTDPNQQINGGTKYISQLLGMYKESGDPRFGIQAYNAGPGTIDLARKNARANGDDPNDYNTVRDKYLKDAYKQLVPKGMFDGKYADNVLAASSSYSDKQEQSEPIKPKLTNLLATGGDFISPSDRKKAEKVEGQLVDDISQKELDNPIERMKLFKDVFESSGSTTTAKTLAMAVTFDEQGNTLYNGKPFIIPTIEKKNSLNDAIAKNSSPEKETEKEVEKKSLLTPQAQNENLDSSFVKQMLQERIDMQLNELKQAQGAGYREGNKNPKIRKLEELQKGLQRIDPDDKNVKGTEAYKRKILSEIV